MSATNSERMDETKPSRSEPSAEAHDGYLEALLHFVLGVHDEHSSNTATLTLTIGGTLISGSVIARRTWIDLMAEQVRPANAEVADNLHEFYDTLEASFEKDPQRPRQFIHLRDAYAIQDSGTPVELGIWRGRLSQISGWSLGAHRPDKEHRSTAPLP